MEQKSGKSTKQIFRKRHKDNFWPILATFTQFWIFLTKTETKYLLSSVNGPLPLCKKKKKKRENLKRFSEREKRSFLNSFDPFSQNIQKELMNSSKEKAATGNQRTDRYAFIEPYFH